MELYWKKHMNWEEVRLSGKQRVRFSAMGSAVFSVRAAVCVWVFTLLAWFLCLAASVFCCCNVALFSSYFLVEGSKSQL